SKRAAELCKQMLAYSGKGNFVLKQADLSQVVREMDQLLRLSIANNAAVRFHLVSTLPPVECDVNQIRQALLNLVTNGSEAIGEESGVITIATGVQDADRD